MVDPLEISIRRLSHPLRDQDLKLLQVIETDEFFFFLNGHSLGIGP